MKSKVQLGDRVQDVISQFKGIAIAKTEWLYGCVRFTVAPEELHEGKAIDPQSFDEPQLKILEANALHLEPQIEELDLTDEETSLEIVTEIEPLAAAAPHGDRPSATRHSDPRR
jgi:hypothetical protein